MQCKLSPETGKVWPKYLNFIICLAQYLQNNVYCPCFERSPVLSNHTIEWWLYTGFTISWFIPKLWYTDKCPNQPTYRQWCDDETWRGPQVLIAVDVKGVGHTNSTVVNVIIPVITQLLLPLKVVDIINLKDKMYRSVHIIDKCTWSHQLVLFYLPLPVPFLMTLNFRYTSN